MTQLRTLEGAIAYVRKSVHTITHHQVERRANTVLLKARMDIASMIKEFTDLCHIVTETNPDRTRVKRFLGLLLAISSLTMSLFNQAEILLLQGEVSDIATRQNHIVDILQEHEVAVHNLQHDVVAIRDGFLSLTNMVEESSAITKIYDAEIQIVMALAELRRTMVCIQSGVQQLMNHRIPLCFLNTTQMQISLKNLATSAAKHHLEMVSTHVSEILQYETSFLISKGQIHIFLHVPLVNNALLLDLLKFNNAAVHISGTLSVQLAPPEDILAIGKDGSHTTITTSALNQLTQYGLFFFSDTAMPLHRQLNATCLGTIFSQNYDNIKSTCPAKFMQASELFVNISPGEYLFYSSKPQTLQIQCHKNTSFIAVQHSSRLRLDDNCEVRSENFITRAGHDLRLAASIIKWPSSWNVSDLLFDVDSKSMEEVVKGLKLINYPPMPIRNLHLLLQSVQHNHHWFTAAICFLAALMLLVVCFLFYRYIKIRKNLPSAPVAAIEEAAAE